MAFAAFLGFLDLIASNSEFFIAAHALIFFTAFDAGRVVLDAVALAGPRLLRNGVVGIFVAMTIGFIAFAQFRGDIINELPGVCSTLYECVGNSLVQGWLTFSEAGVLGGSVPNRIDQASKDQTRIFLRFMYWAAWNIVIFNIFIALLLEAYATIRGTKVERENDEQEYCLVCSLPKKHFEENVGSHAFRRHKQHEHRSLA